VPCSLIEMQKVKSPGTINTHAAKAMNADFVLGLTGTPIENRLEDLWCIMDRVAPGYLGDLKSFSATHSEDSPEALKQLKTKLDEPQEKLVSRADNRCIVSSGVGSAQTSSHSFRIDALFVRSEGVPSNTMRP
jgi:hypothetical protein